VARAAAADAPRSSGGDVENGDVAVGPAAGEHCLPSDWKRTMDGSAPDAMVRSMAALVRDAIDDAAVLPAGDGGPVSLLRSKTVGEARQGVCGGRGGEN